MGVFSIFLAGLMSISGIWSRWDVNDGNWDQLAPLLQQNGFDTVFYMAAYGPVVDHDGLQECLDACIPLGIDVHAWVVMWRIDYVPDSLRSSLINESRMQAYCPAYNDGEIIINWLNPTDPRNVELMAKTCLDIAASYPVSGIHLDYIRYKYYLSGYSEATGERFMEENNLCRLDWPDDCLREGRYYDEFMEWRAGKITAAISAVRDSLDRINKVVLLSAAVFPHEREMLLFGQMWDWWLDSGLLDFVVTMNYTESDSQFTLWAEEQIPLAGDNTLLCGIGALSSTSDLTREQVMGQIRMAAEFGYDGTVIYYLCDLVVGKLLTGNPSETHCRENGARL